MPTILMHREPSVDVIDPTWQQVRKLMKKILADRTYEEELCLTLSYQDEGKPAQLTIIRVHQADAAIICGWLVEYTPPERNGCLVLATADQHSSSLACEFFGAVVDIFDTCLVREANIQKAVEWFMKTGKPNPSQIWIDYFTAIEYR